MSKKSPVSLPQETHLGYVHLSVSNLKNSLDFYQHTLGLQIQDQYEDTTYLGAGRSPLLALTEIPGAVLAPRRTGLYHFALLTPSRKALAGFLNHLITTQTSIQGASDHGVSEAIYMPDPDGNGIEIYRDRPQEEWEYESSGVLKMVNSPFDIDGVLAELKDADDWQGMEPETILGHMHLHVSQLDQAREFYLDTIGFDLVMDWEPSAAFMSAGGYHHHLGLNVWNGVGAPPPPPNTLGLRYFTTHLGKTALNVMRQRLQEKEIGFEEREGGVFLHDPAQNGLLFVE